MSTLTTITPLSLLYLNIYELAFWLIISRHLTLENESIVINGGISSPRRSFLKMECKNFPFTGIWNRNVENVSCYLLWLRLTKLNVAEAVLMETARTSSFGYLFDPFHLLSCSVNLHITLPSSLRSFKCAESADLFLQHLLILQYCPFW